ncbi:MAG: DUF72 domain-containing protein [Xenococcaceae cyanobacterium]
MLEERTSNFFLGCAVWAYKGWVGDFYPTKTRNADFLSLYSRRFTTVEGNTTFYAIPDREKVKRWREETADGFKFCLKLPKEYSHQGLLQPYISDTLSFIEQMQVLGDRLGAIFVQLPPKYSPELLEDLIAFLEALPSREVAIALEVRHRDWFKKIHANKLTEILQQLNIGRVLLDSRPVYSGEEDPQIASERRKPKVPVQFITTTSFSLIRFISHPNLLVNQPFLEEWVIKIKQWLQEGKQIYFFVHCPIEERSPHNARYFQKLLEESNVSIPPLPWNNLDCQPQQLNLW